MPRLYEMDNEDSVGQEKIYRPVNIDGTPRTQRGKVFWPKLFFAVFAGHACPFAVKIGLLHSSEFSSDNTFWVDRAGF